MSDSGDKIYENTSKLFLEITDQHLAESAKRVRPKLTNVSAYCIPITLMPADEFDALMARAPITFSR